MLMKRNPMEKCLAVILSILMVINSTSILAQSNSGSAPAPIRTSTLDSGPVHTTEYDTIYMNRSDSAVAAYARQKASEFATHLAKDYSSYRVEVITGYGCDSAACIVVEYQVDNIQSRELIRYGSSMEQGNYGSISHIPYGPYDPPSPPEPSPSEGEGSNSSSRRPSGPSPDAVSQLDGLVREAESLQSDINAANSEHEAVKRNLDSKEDLLQSAVTARNKAAAEMRDASIEAREAKQKASDAKVIGDYVARQLAGEENNRNAKQSEFDNIQAQLDSLMAEADKFEEEFKPEPASISESDRNNEAHIESSGNSHNNAINDLHDIAKINEGLESLDMEMETILDPTNQLGPDQLNPSELEVSSHHPSYDDLNEAARYANAARKAIQTTGESEDQGLLLDLADLTVSMAEGAIQSGSDALANDLIGTSLAATDMALDFIPGASAVNDAIKIATGRNLWTGEKLDDIEIALIAGSFFVPAAIAGTGKVIARSAKMLVKVVEKGKSGNKLADDMLDSIRRSDKKLGDTSGQRPCNIVGLDYRLFILPVFDFLFPTAYASDCLPDGVITDQVVESATKSKLDVSVVDNSANNAADYVRFKTHLKFMEDGILDTSGTLTRQAVTDSRLLIRGSDLNNPAVISELTGDGSNIADWGKYTTKAVTNSSGQNLQVHFYRNGVNGNINYNIDFKVNQVVQP